MSECTFGGNPLACAVAAEVLDIVDDAELLAGDKRKHDLFIDRLRNATEITSPSGLLDRPSSALRQQLHSPAMRLLLRLEYERLFGASWSTYFVRIPYGDQPNTRRLRSASWTGVVAGLRTAEAWQGRSKDVVKAARAHGLIVLIAGPDVVRLSPSLIIPDELIDTGSEPL